MKTIQRLHDRIIPNQIDDNAPHIVEQNTNSKKDPSSKENDPCAKPKGSRHGNLHQFQWTNAGSKLVDRGVVDGGIGHGTKEGNTPDDKIEDGTPFGPCVVGNRCCIHDVLLNSTSLVFQGMAIYFF